VETTINTGRQMILLMQTSLYIDTFFSLLEQCASGWLQTGSTCYHFSHEPENWPAAEVYVVILNVSPSSHIIYTYYSWCLVRVWRLLNAASVLLQDMLAGDFNFFHRLIEQINSCFTYSHYCTKYFLVSFIGVWWIINGYQ